MIQTQTELCRQPALTSKQEEEPVGAQKKGWTKTKHHIVPKTGKELRPSSGIRRQHFLLL
jgi:hypothetical protein